MEERFCCQLDTTRGVVREVEEIALSSKTELQTFMKSCTEMVSSIKSDVESINHMTMRISDEEDPDLSPNLLSKIKKPVNLRNQKKRLNEKNLQELIHGKAKLPICEPILDDSWFSDEL